MIPVTTRSRVHELARRSRTELVMIYLDLLGNISAGETASAGVQGWDRDQLVTAIRDIEDPREVIR